MEIHYIYHSCFAVQTDVALLVFDYWKDSADGLLKRLVDQRGNRQLYFLVSHFHEDHYNASILDYDDARRIISYDTAKRCHIGQNMATAILRPGDTYSDEYMQLHALRSTDVGISSLVTLADGTTLYHAGDNNDWYFTHDTDAHIKCSLKEMEGLFFATVRMAKSITPKIDHVMFPLDPRLGDEVLRGARHWLKHIRTGHFYPMHCWQRYDEVNRLLAILADEYPETEFVSCRD